MAYEKQRLASRYRSNTLFCSWMSAEPSSPGLESGEATTYLYVFFVGVCFFWDPTFPSGCVHESVHP
eukprot:3257167-Amphidinium_carterae.1